MSAKKKVQPKGKAKGGTRFPRYALDAVVDNIPSFLTKVHTGPITVQELSSGVFKLGASSSAGRVRLAAMKHFGLAAGTYKEITATDLSRRIGSTSGDARLPYLQQAFFNVEPFKKVFDVFTGETVTKERIGEYAYSPLKVHPDNRDEFAKVFAASATAAGLAAIDGDQISLVPPQEVLLPSVGEAEIKPSADREEVGVGEEKGLPFPLRTGRRAVPPNITIAIDPTLDPEKLEKQLEVLKRYGLI